MRSHLFISFFLVICSLNIWSQDYYFRVNHLDMEDGLSFRHATSVLQDHEGYIWIGTRNGLNRFDGYQFIHFTTNSKNGFPSLSGNYIHDLDIDPSGNIWIATNTGLDILNPSNYTIKSYTPQEVFNNKKGIKTIDEITITKESGRIFIHSHQFQRFDRFYNTVEFHGQEFRELSFTDDQSNHYEYIANVFEDSDRTLWARPAYSKTFYSLANDYSIISKFELPDSINGHSIINVTSPNQIQLDSSGLFKRNLEFIRSQDKDLNLVGTFCDSRETFMMKGNLKNGFSCINEHIGLEAKHMPINDFIDKDGDLWLMLDRDILVMSNKQINRIPRSLIDLDNNAVTYFFQSRDGTVWITTNFGIYRVLKERNPFKFHLNTAENGRGYGRSMRGIEIGEKNTLYGSVVHDGVWETNTSTGEEMQILSANFDNGIKNYSILPYAMHYSDQILWICNWFDEGLLKFNTQTKVLSHIHCEDNMDGFSRAMVYDESGVLWVGTDHGLNLLDLSTESLRLFKPAKGAEILNKQDISALLIGQHNQLWIGSRENGLFQVDDDNHFSLVANKSSGLSDNTILSLCEHGDYLWIGTMSGLNRYNKHSGAIVAYNQNHGLPNNQINAIMEMNGFIWLSTNNGLCRFNIETESGSSYYKEDGLVHQEFNYSSQKKLKNGNLLFGGMNGIVEIEKKQTPKPLNNEQIILTGFKKSVGSDDLQLINSARLVKDGVDLYHTDKSFSFEFALLDLFSSKHIKYKYKLEGYDDDWTLIGSENKVRFNKLPPGEYTFKVRALGKDGVWSDFELQVPIRVHQVFYKTWWFISMVVLAVLLIFYLIYRMRIRQLEKMARLRVKIASDLHDDVGSMLTQIAMQSELVGAKIYGEEVEKEEMLKIARNSRQAVNTMSDVVWSIDSRQDKLQDLLDRMKDYAGDALNRANITFSFEFKGNIKEKKHLKAQFRQNVYLIFKEAINNIVKHSDASHVAISLENSRQSFAMSISDNGTKSKNEGRLPGQGHKNMHMRAKQINGKLQIDDSEGYLIRLTIN